MGKIKSKNKSLSSIGKYLPVFVILLAISIIIGSTFAYFTDKTEEESTLTFSKVELSGETTTGINGKLRDVIPGTPLVDGALKFSKSIDSEAIYVRAKISFSLPVEYANDNDMKQMVDLLRSATDFNIVSEAQNGAVWSAKDGNYFYLVNSADITKLMRVDTIDTYLLSNEIVVPRDLTSLPDNAQYMKSVNFHVAFEAIQADNVSDILSETKETFNDLFPENENEKFEVKHQVTFKGFDGISDLKVEKVEAGYILSEPEVDIPLDVNNEPLYIIDGWYTDSELTNKYEFGQVIKDGLTLYPRAYEVSQGLAFSEVEENGEVVAYSVAKGTCTNTKIIMPNTYKGLPVTNISDNGFENMSTLVDVYFPKDIICIGNSAFAGCTALNLTSLPSSVEKIGSNAFNGCDLPSNDNVYYLGINGTDNNIVIAAKSTSIVSVEWPENVTMIADAAFYNCTNLELATLPDSIISIGVSAFYSCAKITLTSLPSGLTEIKDETFKYCSLLALTSLPSGLTSIGASAFDMCSYVTITSLPSGLKTIGDGAFYMAGSISLSTLPDSITSIGENAFNSCINVTITSLPSSLVSLGDYAFASTGVNITELPSGVTTVGDYVFAYTSMKMLKLPSSLQTVSANAFKDNDNLFLVLCENQDVANLVKGKCVYDTYIYVLDSTGYAQGTSESTYVINSNVTVYTAYTDDYKWARINNEYYKCISAGIM